MSFEIKHGILVASVDEDNKMSGIIQFWAYESRPDKKCIEALKEKLKTNPEYGLHDRNDWGVLEAPSEVIEIFKEELGVAEEGQYFSLEKQAGCCDDDYCECE